jgi:uncharacterized membrane protein YbhN (UPF0104 family)
MRLVGWKRWLVGIVLVGFGVVFAIKFPWQVTWAALAGASASLLLLATVINLLSMFAKAWAWHLLLRPHAPHRFWSAQIATFVGAAVNCLSIAVGGEAARVAMLTKRDGVNVTDAAAGILASRVVEALALVAFVAVASLFLTAVTWIVALRLIAWGLLLVVLAAFYSGLLGRGAARLPAGVQRWLQPLLGTNPRPALAAPLALGLVNWICEWVTYDLCLKAAGLELPTSASLVALLAANIGGIPRLTPANIGLMQLSVMAGLEPFNVPMPDAMAAGLVLQAVQTLPTIAVGAALGGTATLRDLLRRPVPAG